MTNPVPLVFLFEFGVALVHVGLRDRDYAFDEGAEFLVRRGLTHRRSFPHGGE